MTRHAQLAAALLVCWPAWLTAQPGQVEVEVYRTVTLPAGQARFSAWVRAPLKASVPQIAAAFQDVGLVVPDHLRRTSVSFQRNGFSSDGPSQRHEFSWMVPVDRADAVGASLARTQAVPAAPVESLVYSSELLPLDSVAEETGRRLVPEMLVEARARAEAQWAAAGQPAGPIVHLAFDRSPQGSTLETTYRLLIRMAPLIGAGPVARTVAVSAESAPETAAWFDVVRFSVAVPLSPGKTRKDALETVKPLGLTEADIARQTTPITLSGDLSGLLPSLGLFVEFALD